MIGSSRSRARTTSGGSEIGCRAGLWRDRLPRGETAGVVGRRVPGGGDRPRPPAGRTPTRGDQLASDPEAGPSPRGRQEPDPVRPLVLGQEAADLGPQVVVPAAGGAEPDLPPGGDRSGPRHRTARRSVASAPASSVSPSELADEPGPRQLASPAPPSPPRRPAPRRPRRRSSRRSSAGS